MNESVKEHLTRAKDYLAQGDEFYRKAKPEIDLAHQKGASYREISRFLQKSESWVRDVIYWDGRGTLYGKDTERRQLDMAKQVLRESSESEMDTLVAGLPRDAKKRLENAVAKDSAERTEPIKVSPNPLGVEIKIAQKVAHILVLLHETRELCGSVDRPGDDEDTIEDLDRVIREAQATKEAYLSGESIDTGLSRILN